MELGGSLLCCVLILNAQGGWNIQQNTGNCLLIQCLEEPNLWTLIHNLVISLSMASFHSVTFHTSSGKYCTKFPFGQVKQHQLH